MRRAFVVVALLLLTACSPSSSYVKGEVVSCESISQDKTFTGGVTMDCLDRSEGAQLGALRGPMIVNVWDLGVVHAKKRFLSLDPFMKKLRTRSHSLALMLKRLILMMAEPSQNETAFFGPIYMTQMGVHESTLDQGFRLPGLLQQTARLQVRKLGHLKMNQN